jgi:type II secretory pathway component PulM
MTRRFTALPRRDRRALSLGALVAIPALVYGAAVRPYVAETRAVRAQAESERALLDRELAALRSASADARFATNAAARLARGVTRLFAGVDAADAGSALLDYVSARAAGSRVLVERMESQPSTAVGAGLEAVTVEVQARTDFEGALSFLHALDGGPSLVRVERITLSRGAAAGPDDEVLLLSAVVTGYHEIATGRAVGTAAAGEGSAAATVAARDEEERR